MEKAFEVTAAVLEEINAYAVEPLAAEDVYCFSLTLCDNDIDRDYERFSKEALEGLAELFKGKTGVFDHDPKGSRQTARIFRTRVVQTPNKKTADGQEYYSLTAKAYMVRTAANADLIKEISGGIKKEVSVSCSMAKRSCSICGLDRTKGRCSHVKGRRYPKGLCFDTLEKPTDAYEWSFVAVPAQVNAGVTKRFEGAGGAIPEDGALLRELETAKGFIRGEILKTSYFCKPFYPAQQVEELTKDMDTQELLDILRKLKAQLISLGEELKMTDESFATAAGAKEKEENKEYTL